VNKTNDQQFKRVTPFNEIRMFEWIFFIMGCLLTVIDFISTHGQNLLPAKVLVTLAAVSKIFRWYLSIIGFPTAIPNWKSGLAALFLTLFCFLGGKYGPDILQNISLPNVTTDIIINNDQDSISDTNRPDARESLDISLDMEVNHEDTINQ
jgi:hypothetical protein